MKALAYIEERAGRADVQAALDFLGRVPDRAPMAGDER